MAILLTVQGTGSGQSGCHQSDKRKKGRCNQGRCLFPIHKRYQLITRKMGADDFIATNEDPDWSEHHTRSLDLIISTVSSSSMPLQKYLDLLRTNGVFIQVGAPDESMPAFNAFALIEKGVKLGGSSIGSPAEIKVILASPFFRSSVFFFSFLRYRLRFIWRVEFQYINVGRI